MQYALLVYRDQSAWAELDDDEAARLRAESMPRWIALFEEIGQGGSGGCRRELEAAIRGEGRPRRSTASGSSPTGRSRRRRSRSAGSS